MKWIFFFSIILISLNTFSSQKNKKIKSILSKNVIAQSTPTPKNTIVPETEITPSEDKDFHPIKAYQKADTDFKPLKAPPLLKGQKSTEIIENDAEDLEHPQTSDE